MKMKISKLTRFFNTKYGLEEMRNLLKRWEARGRVASQDAIKDLEDFLESAGVSFVALDEARSEFEAKVSGADALYNTALSVLLSARDRMDRILDKMFGKVAKLEAKIASLRARANAKANDASAEAEAKAADLQTQAAELRNKAVELDEIIDLLS